MTSEAVMPREQYELKGTGIEIAYRRGEDEVTLTLGEDEHLGGTRGAEASEDMLGVRVDVELLVSRSGVRETLTLFLPAADHGELQPGTPTEIGALAVLARDFSHALSGRQATLQVYDVKPLTGTMTLTA